MSLLKTKKSNTNKQPPKGGKRIGGAIMTRYEQLQNQLDAVNEKILFFALPDTNTMRHLLDERANLEHRLHTMTVEEAHAEVVE